MLSKNRLILLLFISVLFSAMSCGDMPLGGIGKGDVLFEDQTFFRQLDGCRIDTLPCALVKTTFPVAICSSTSVCEKINDSIFYRLRFSLAHFAVTVDEIPDDLDGIAEQLFEEYRAMQAYQPNYYVPWEISTRGKVLFQSPKVISIQLDNYTFAGGAHPSTNTTILNFDAETGDILRINDFVTNQEELEMIVERAFRELHDIKPGSPVKRSEFFWGEPFHLPDNFAILESGVYFFYNPYEVAAYAARPTDFTISYKDLEGVLEKKRIF